MTGRSVTTVSPPQPPSFTPAAGSGVVSVTRRPDNSTAQALFRFAAIVATVALLIIAALEASVIIGTMARPDLTVGLDFHIYLERTRSWLAGDGFYLERQLTGPYSIAGAYPVMYPPTLLYLTVPFTVLPAILWWLIPLGIIGASLYRLRPAVWTWPILAATLCIPQTWMVLIYGNPSLWSFAALAAGLAWTWPLAFVALKPTLAPFALVGVRRRSFWMGVAAFALLALPFGAMWLDYLTVILNTRNELGIEYLVGQWPLGVALVVSGLTSPRRRQDAPRTRRRPH
jgi:hypothetical protein